MRPVDRRPLKNEEGPFTLEYRRWNGSTTFPRSITSSVDPTFVHRAPSKVMTTEALSRFLFYQDVKIQQRTHLFKPLMTEFKTREK